MSEMLPLRLLRGHTVHQRSVPFTHRFKYDLALIDIDIDRLDAADQMTGLFNVDRSGLFSFNRKDHGGRTPKALRPWANAQFEQAGLTAPTGAVRLVTFPRHMFYKFAPISLWLGYDAGGGLSGILYEVNNTFGETHIYAAETPDPRHNRHEADKVFHVSPFFDVSGAYEFKLTVNEDRLSLVVATKKAGQQTHVATISVVAHPATTGAFVALALRKPLSTLGVTAAIHWQALKLWLKGAKYHSKPKQSSVRITVATEKHCRPEPAPAGEIS